MKEKENRNAPATFNQGLTWKVSANLALLAPGYSIAGSTEYKKWKISFIMN